VDEKKGLKTVELRLISELLKDSRRSDRQLAKSIGVSQPTVTRTVRKLREAGYIKEFTIIPDFKKLGFQILAFSTFKLTEQVPSEQLKEERILIRKDFMKKPLAHIIGMSGTGLNADRMIVSFHESYSSYSGFLQRIRNDPLIKMNSLSSFVVDLTDDNHYDSLTLLPIADYILKMKKNE